MLKILKAEFRRTYKHRRNLIFIGVAAAFSLIILTFEMTEFIGLSSELASTKYQERLSFPISILNSFSLSFIHLIFLTPIISAYMVGSDYQLNTWKMILPRNPQKGLILSGKLINLVIYLFGLFLISLFITHIFSLFGMLWLKVPFFQLNESTLMFEKQSWALDITVFVIWCASVSVLVTLISRSVSIGSSVTFGILILSYLVSKHTADYISMWFVFSHFGNLISKPQSSVELFNVARPSFSVLFSWSVVTGNIVLNLLIGYVVLKKQQFSSS
jgi:ABC-type transport system involved in multi-copper enzyme maturation permease subunit